MKKIKVGIIGCGKIFERHLEAIILNKQYFELVAICDIDKNKVKLFSKNLDVRGFNDYKKMLKEMTNNMDFVSICTPNSLHFEQAVNSLHANYNILIEKPIDFNPKRIEEIVATTRITHKKAFAVLQVRYNPTVNMLKEALSQNIIGNIRSVSLVQRWQRPISYFNSWRANIKIGGRILYEVGIHYLDIAQWLFGLPKVFATKTFKHKHRNIEFEDTVFSLVQYPHNVSGSVEVTIASEPINLECSISVIGSQGYVKIGGKALDKVDKALFLNNDIEKKWLRIIGKYSESLKPNSYGTHQGSCPNHPLLYKDIAKGKGIGLINAIDSVKFIEEIYKKEINSPWLIAKRQ